MNPKTENPKFFTRFTTTGDYQQPPCFVLTDEPHPLARLAATELQHYLSTQTDWEHNFGLAPMRSGPIIGKMFGVLVVQLVKGDLGYLAAFSGKLAGSNQHDKFVPPVFDSLDELSFVNQGMRDLTAMSLEIKQLEQSGISKEEKATQLKSARSQHSKSLQQQIFNNYHFLNQSGEKKSLKELFTAASYKNPPSGAGECAGPKLLHYAFNNHLKPIALTEFWWGLSPKSAQWKHGHFYPCCKEKCAPILKHMLIGL